MGVGITCPNCRNVFAFACEKCSSFETEIYKNLELAQYFQSRGAFYFKCRKCLAEFDYALCPGCGIRVIPEDPFVTGDKGGAPRSGWCFIASACVDERPDIIEQLCRFRDELLAKTRPGRTFIKFYYACSPPAARYISQRNPLKVLTRYLLVYPAYLAASAFLKMSAFLKKN